MRLSEALIASEPALEPFRSVTGFQCVRLSEQDGGGFVTFEGNGRREALRRAFVDQPEVDIQVEVRRSGLIREWVGLSPLSLRRSPTLTTLRSGATLSLSQ